MQLLGDADPLDQAGVSRPAAVAPVRDRATRGTRRPSRVSARRSRLDVALGDGRQSTLLCTLLGRLSRAPRRRRREIRTALDSDDTVAAQRLAHTFKGVAGNSRDRRVRLRHAVGRPEFEEADLGGLPRESAPACRPCWRRCASSGSAGPVPARPAVSPVSRHRSTRARHADPRANSTARSGGTTYGAQAIPRAAPRPCRPRRRRVERRLTTGGFLARLDFRQARSRCWRRSPHDSMSRCSSGGPMEPARRPF